MYLSKITVTQVSFFKKQKLIEIMNKQILEFNWLDSTKGNFDIDVKEIDYFFVPLIKDIFDLHVRIKRAWLHFMKNGASHSSHEHVEPTAVYYLQVPKNSGNLILHNIKETIVPKENDFLIVPALAKHSITENKSDRIRIVLAMLLEFMK